MPPHPGFASHHNMHFKSILIGLCICGMALFGLGPSILPKITNLPIIGEINAFSITGEAISEKIDDSGSPKIVSMADSLKITDKLLYIILFIGLMIVIMGIFL